MFFNEKIQNYSQIFGIDAFDLATNKRFKYKDKKTMKWWKRSLSRIDIVLAGDMERGYNVCDILSTDTVEYVLWRSPEIFSITCK